MGKQLMSGNPSNDRDLTEIQPTALDPIAATHPQIVTNRRVPAWLLSFLLHTLIFVGLILALRPIDRGSGEIENKTGGIVLVDISSDQTEYLSEGDTDEESSANPAAQSPPPAVASEDLPPNLPGMSATLTEITGTGDDLSEALPGAEGLLDGPTNTTQVGGKVTTEVFGIKGTGSRFVYVFDRSESMNGYEARPLIAAKQELMKSLNSLGDTHQFQIVFYNNFTDTFNGGNGRKQMYFATEDMKSKAERFVTSIRGDKGTNHIRALNEAFAFAPDIIFLLTDAEGGFSKSQLNEIARRNRSAAIINAIEFGDGTGSRRRNNSLKSLARENGGQYIYKNIRTLRLK